MKIENKQFFQLMERPQGWESPPRKILQLQNSLEPVILHKKTKTSVTLLCSQSKAAIGTVSERSCHYSKKLLGKIYL